MKILALDSSGLVASVAVYDNGVIQSEYTMNYKKTHSQTLLPMLEEVKELTDLDLDSIDAIAVAAGPGSFTGLRIGSATAKGLGFALNKPIISVPTLEGLAYQFYGFSSIICPIMDARRNQVYNGVYSFEKVGNVYRLVVLKDQRAMDMGDLLEELNRDYPDREVVFLGDGVPVYENQILDSRKGPFSLAPAHRGRQSAACVATLGAVLFEEGKMEPAGEHVPIYLRASQAERERLEAEGKSAEAEGKSE